MILLEIHVDLMREARQRVLTLLLILGVICLATVMRVAAGMAARRWIGEVSFAQQPFGEICRVLAYVRNEVGGAWLTPRAEPIGWRPPDTGDVNLWQFSPSS